MLKNPSSIPSSISRLAGLIEMDLGKRGLRPGDAYMTASEAARLHGVSTMTASRAMALLADRSVLVRRRKLGTLVGPKAVRRDAPALKFLHLLVYQDYLRTEGLLADGVVNGLHAQLPGTDIQFNFMPAQDSLAYVRELTEQSNARGTIEGMILIRCSLDIHRYIEESGLPAVVYGNAFPDSSLPWVDRDQAAVGRKAAEHLIQRGHNKIVMLMRAVWRLGDNRTFNGVLAAAGNAGLGAGNVQVRSVPEDNSVIDAVVRELLAGIDRPSGFICRSRVLADAVRRIATELGLKSPQDYSIVLCDYYPQKGENPPYAFARPEMDPESQGALLGQMLIELAAGRAPARHHLEIPIEVIDPLSQ